MRHAEIIAVGSELLLEGRLDTNSIPLTDGLAAVGVEVRFKTVVGDEPADIVSALRTASRRADVVILTGGLGPTDDDCTRQAVARATGRPLRRRAEAVEGMIQRLAAWGRKPTRAQRRQGLIPEGADVLPNPVGSAPGFCLTWRGSLIAALPGVPVEAEQMFAAAVAPRILARAPGPRPRIDRLQLHTFGLTESELNQRVKGLVKGKHRVRVGLLASPLGVSVTFTACVAGTRRKAAGRILDLTVRRARKRLGPSIFAEGKETMEAVVGRHLAAHELVVAVAESCTGGLIGHRLTQIPGSSAYLDHVTVCYSNRAKTELLGVPAGLIRLHGAVSAQTAAAMARGVRRKSRTPIGLSVTGIAGPDGGTWEKPVGLVYVGLDAQASDGSQKTSLTREFRFYGTREAIKLRASQAALNLLREWLITLRSRRS